MPIIFVQKVIGTGAANEDALDGWELIEEDPEKYAIEPEKPIVDSIALTAERERLIARIAEIDSILEGVDA